MGKFKELFTEAEDRLLKVEELEAWEDERLEKKAAEVGREWIERIDNPELSDSEREWLENEADYYGRYDLMDEYRREADMCGDSFDPKEGP